MISDQIQEYLKKGTDLILPRVMAGEKPGARDLARLGHGGLCLNCKTCRFPGCSFGKSG